MHEAVASPPLVKKNCCACFLNRSAPRLRRGVLKNSIIFADLAFPQLRCQLSTVNCQLSTVNCQLSTVNCQLSTVNCQLSTVNCQLSTDNCQLSPVNCQLSTVNCPIKYKI